MTMAQKKKKMGMVGAGIVAATAAGVAAGYYFYASKNAQKNRRIAAKWAKDLKDDVMKKAKQAGGKVDRKKLLSIVDTAVRTYENVRDIDKKDVQRAARELKDNWRTIAEEVVATVGAKKVARKSAPAKKKVSARSKK